MLTRAGNGLLMGIVCNSCKNSMKKKNWWARMSLLRTIVHCLQPELNKLANKWACVCQSLRVSLFENQETQTEKGRLLCYPLF